MTRRLILVTHLIVTVGWLLLTPAPSDAHSDFESSDPEDGTIVIEPLTQIVIAFSDPVVPNGSGFEILEPNGQVSEARASSIDGGSTWILEFDPSLSAGEVAVRYDVSSQDGHTVRGGWSFVLAIQTETSLGDDEPSGGSQSHGTSPSTSSTVPPQTTEDAAGRTSGLLFAIAAAGVVAAGAAVAGQRRR